MKKAIFVLKMLLFSTTSTSFAYAEESTKIFKKPLTQEIMRCSSLNQPSVQANLIRDNQTGAKTLVVQDYELKNYNVLYEGFPLYETIITDHDARYANFYLGIHEDGSRIFELVIVRSGTKIDHATLKVGYRIFSTESPINMGKYNLYNMTCTDI